MMVVLSLSIFN